MYRDKVFDIARKSVQFIPSKRDEKRHSHNNYMFYQDVQTSIFPYKSGSDDKYYKFELSEEDEIDFKRIFLLFRGVSQYADWNLTDFFTNVFRVIATNLASSGKLVYELSKGTIEYKGIPFIHSVAPPDKFRSEVLVKIPGPKIIINNTVFQLLLNLKSNNEKKLFVKIPGKSVWVNKVPRKLGGQFGHFLQQKKLIQSSAVAPKFGEENIAEIIKNSIVNINDYYFQKDVLKFSATKKWGWHGRLHFGRSDNISEYYFYYKQLTFAKSMAILREHILEEINKLFSRLEIANKLILKGIHYPDDVQEKIDEMWKGEFIFDDVFKFIY